MYIKRKGSIAGPAFKIPFIGPFAQAIDPKFDGYFAQWASGPLSCVSVFDKYVPLSSPSRQYCPLTVSTVFRFVVLVSERDLAHKVFKSPAFAEPCIVLIAKDLLGHEAWVFLQGRDHTEFRRGLMPLFTNKALATYFEVHDKVLFEYFDEFVSIGERNGGKPKPFMTMFREINCALSCRTFFGDYIPQAVMKRIADDFYLATAVMELVNVPLSMYIPGTKQWLGKRTCDAVHVEFAKAAAVCKANMANGATPMCTVDYWVLHMIESNKYRERIAAGELDAEKPSNLIRDFTNKEISETLFTFLFASQDAGSSATTWLFQILAQRPDVLDRLRQENLDARGGDRNKHFDVTMGESLTYTNAVVKELLRHRPPVIFVPYLATKDFPVTPNYTVPKGSMVIPSCYPALHDPADYPNLTSTRNAGSLVMLRRKPRTGLCLELGRMVALHEDTVREHPVHYYQSIILHFLCYDVC